MDTIFNELLRSPCLMLYRERIHAVLEAERVLRQQFYTMIEQGGKAEFINGEIIMHSSVKLKYTNASRRLLNLVTTFVEQHDLGFVGYEKTLITLSRNDYEPEICFFSRARAEHFTNHQFRFPAPDFVVEFVTPGTNTTDRTIKMEDYAAHGITEYWIVDPEAETLEQYLHQQDIYTLHTKARSGTVESVALPGFAISIRAVFERAEHLAALRQLLA